MAVERAADLAGMFSTDDFAETATYTPAAGGGSSSVSVILDRPVEGATLDAIGAMIDAVRLHVRAADVADLSRGDTFVVGADTLQASTDGELDATRSIWSVGCR